MSSPERSISERYAYHLAHIGELLYLIDNAETLGDAALHTHRAWWHTRSLEKLLRRQDSILLYRLHGRGWSKAQIRRHVRIAPRTLNNRLIRGARIHEQETAQ